MGRRRDGYWRTCVREKRDYGAKVGFVTTIVLVSTFGLLALRPPMPHQSSPWNVQFGLGFLINEQPFLGMYWLAIGTVPALIRSDLDPSQRWLMVAAMALPASVLIALAARTRTARPALTAALREGLGDRYARTPRRCAPASR